MSAINPWGPLGKPSKEQIQEWCNWSEGRFTEYKRMMTRKRKGKTQSEHTVYLIKEVSDCFVAEVKVFAFDVSEAMKSLGYDYSKFDYSSEPFKKGKVSYRVTHYKPTE